MVGFNTHLSVNPSKTLLTMTGKSLAFQSRNLGRQPLNQTHKMNVSCNGTNWYQLTNAHIISAGIVLTKNNDEGKQKNINLGYPRGPVVKPLPSNAAGVGSIPSWGIKIPHAMQFGQKIN